MRALALSARQPSDDLPKEVLRDLERRVDVEEVPWDGRDWDFGED
jgi:hypothetical protein